MHTTAYISQEGLPKFWCSIKNSK